MEDFWRFLLIAGVVLIGIYRESSKAKRAKEKQPAPPPASPFDDDDPGHGSMSPSGDRPASPFGGYTPPTPPMPEAWNPPRHPMDELLNPVPVEPPAAVAEPRTPKKKKRKDKANALAASGGTIRQTTSEHRHAPFPDTTSHDEPAEDFAIRSAEEARRAIIWGEILQRKY